MLSFQAVCRQELESASNVAELGIDDVDNIVAVSLSVFDSAE